MIINIKMTLLRKTHEKLTLHTSSMLMMFNCHDASLQTSDCQHSTVQTHTDTSLLLHSDTYSNVPAPPLISNTWLVPKKPPIRSQRSRSSHSQLPCGEHQMHRRGDTTHPHYLQLQKFSEHCSVSLQSSLRGIV